GVMLLDSDVFIDLVRQHPPAQAWFSALPEVPSVTGVGVGELAFGCRSAADLAALRRFLLPFPVALLVDAAIVCRSRKDLVWTRSNSAGLARQTSRSPAWEWAAERWATCGR